MWETETTTWLSVEVEKISLDLGSHPGYKSSQASPATWEEPSLMFSSVGFLWMMFPCHIQLCCADLWGVLDLINH